jgi:hypothetical protein
MIFSCEPTYVAERTFSSLGDNVLFGAAGTEYLLNSPRCIVKPGEENVGRLPHSKESQLDDLYDVLRPVS